MRLQLWILTQSQILDMVFSEYPWDITSSASRRQLLDSLDRVSKRENSKFLSPSILIPLLGKAIAWKLSSQLESIKTAAKWIISMRSLSQGQTDVGITLILRPLMNRKSRERRLQRIMELLSVDVTAMTWTYLGRILIRPLISRSFSKVRAPWILRALNNWPGVRLIQEVHVLDGTLIYLDPPEYLRKTPALLKDALLAPSASFTAAALVGSAFVRGEDVRQLWSDLLGKDIQDDNTPRRKALNSVLQALGLPRTEYDTENGIKPVSNLGAIDAATWLQRLFTLVLIPEEEQSAWRRLRAGVADRFFGSHQRGGMVEVSPLKRGQRFT